MTSILVAAKSAQSGADLIPNVLGPVALIALYGWWRKVKAKRAEEGCTESTSRVVNAVAVR